MPKPLPLKEGIFCSRILLWEAMPRCLGVVLLNSFYTIFLFSLSSVSLAPPLPPTSLPLSPAFFPEAKSVQGGEEISSSEHTRVKTKDFQKAVLWSGTSPSRKLSCLLVTVCPFLPWGSAFS